MSLLPPLILLFHLVFVCFSLYICVDWVSSIRDVLPFDVLDVCFSCAFASGRHNCASSPYSYVLRILNNMLSRLLLFCSFLYYALFLSSSSLRSCDLSSWIVLFRPPFHSSYCCYLFLLLIRMCSIVVSTLLFIVPFMISCSIYCCCVSWSSCHFNLISRCRTRLSS